MTRRKQNGLGALLIAVAVALAGSGCGGKSNQSAAKSPQSSSSSVASRVQTGDSAGQPPSHSQFVAKAERICRRFNAEIVAIEPKNESRREIERVVPQRVALEHEALTTLRKLRPPSSLERFWAQMLSARSALVDELNELLAAARKDDEAGISRLAASKALAHATLSGAANGGGFAACGRIGGTGHA
ncbi:MAG TPA: hypothetical protein VL988_10285 [Solirubrobacteraceae bacterium]|nr:hypothetical protein [Solirubrobacteraceae bacterium]